MWCGGGFLMQLRNTEFRESIVFIGNNRKASSLVKQPKKWPR